MADSQPSQTLFRMVPEVPDDGMSAQIKRRIGYDITSVSLTFDDLDLTGEPWLYLQSMVVKKPARAAFLGEMGEPGPWTVGFSNSLLVHYGTVAKPTELARMAGIYVQISTAYFSWKALGGSDSESRRTLKSLEPIMLEARKLLDVWDTAQVSREFGKQKGDEFALLQASGRIPLSKRASLSLSSVMRKKPVPGHDGAAFPAAGGKFQQIPAAAQTPSDGTRGINDSETKNRSSSSTRPGKRQREALKAAKTGASVETTGDVGDLLSVADSPRRTPKKDQSAGSPAVKIPPAAATPPKGASPKFVPPKNMPPQRPRYDGKGGKGKGARKDS